MTINTREIKKVLSAHYGRGNVRVTMSRGYWARIHIDLTPLDYEQANVMRDEARKLLVAAGCDLVDMEVAAIAQVAATLGLPWAAIKAPTDEANGASAGDFHTNLLAAAARAAAGVEALVARL